MAKHTRPRRGKGSQLAWDASRLASSLGHRSDYDSIVRPRLKPKTQAQLDWTRGKRVC